MSARYEPIIVRRATEEVNGDGDPVPGAWSDHVVLSGKFAPSNPSEALDPGRKTVITGGTVYVRDLANRPDIEATDRATIRGVEYAIDGEIGAWLRAGSWAVQFAVKAVN
ncbi:head-tail adaptor protein [Microbacterium sp. Kw_RZR3]|uniref:head-tail adaptor protein n=1 Tax=Microbacterium sp. Kw_RZR3 TaxID=3032903 RepID=UPI0023DAA41C|nr:head-tail adaptor protein [Microbacterium sp. Kw_RZR3]MDF2045148.1 head-tail adaptor protein [Microbacterium sp. Kw_RZR3]